MRGAVVQQLAGLSGSPAVSILCPLDTRSPGNAHDPAVLADLRERAASEARALLSAHAASALIERIDATLAAVDLRHPTPGVGIFVSPEVARVIPLDASVDPYVVVGERFALGGVLAVMQQSRRARAVVLSQAKTRCVDITGNDAVDRVDHGFPVEIAPPVEADTPHHDFPMDEHEHAEAAKFVFRAVAHALEALQQGDERPLVLVGAERDLAYFDEVARRTDVAGRVHGNHERDSADVIADLARPVLDAYELEEQQAASRLVREAIGARGVGGIADSWSAAREGRGHRLVVEREFRFVARIAGGTLEPAHDGDPGAFDAVEDTIEETIRHDGEVLVVPPDSIPDLGRIALLTRY